MFCFGCGMRLIIRVGGRRISMPKDVLEWSPRDMLCEECYDEIVGRISKK